MNAAAREVIARLRLEPLPGEGGYFRQTSCTETASSILFLLTAQEFSALHRIAQDEMWHFYAGDRIEHVQIDPASGAIRRERLGPDVLAGDVPQVFVAAGVWQGARLAGAGEGGTGYALVGCTVSPPWEKSGFELGDRSQLQHEFPPHAEWVRALTR